MPDTLHADVPVATPLPPRLFAQLTCVTPTRSLAVPASRREPEVAVKLAADGRRGNDDDRGRCIEGNRPDERP